MIPKSFIQDLLNRVDIVDVIERYVPLKKAGANYVACCPFHNEKSPSFTVSQSKQFYHCFGCGAHGTAIGFVMEHVGLGFVEAVEELARSIGVSVPREAPPPGHAQHNKAEPDLYEVMQTATRYYRDQLKQSPRAIDYLKRRGLSGEICARFGIGYAPDNWQNLESVFPDYKHANLLEAGLVIENDDHKRYDRFRDRIMFPIVNQRGQVIGFGGRILDKGEPKYLNSPETPLFEKGRELYGLYQAQKAIRAQRAVLVVEGYMDVVALAQHGVEYAVATLGTATTPYHVQKLLRMADQVVFSFDGDSAGRRAAWRALENSLPQIVDGKRIDFLFLPTEHDPDSYIRENGKDAFEQLIRQAHPLSSYLLQELSAGTDLHTHEGKSRLLERARPLVTAIQAPTTALLLRKEIAALAGITLAELESLYAIKSSPATSRRAPQIARRTESSSLRNLLRCMIAEPELARELPVEWQAVGNDASLAAALLEYLVEQEYAVNTATIIQNFQGTPLESSVNEISSGIQLLGGQFDFQAEFRTKLAELLEEREKALRQQQLHELNIKMKQAGMGLKGLDEQEKTLYRQLTSQSGKADTL